MKSETYTCLIDDFELYNLKTWIITLYVYCTQYLIPKYIRVLFLTFWKGQIALLNKKILRFVKGTINFNEICIYLRL